ncbi:hypothetical protein BASA83_008258 [Batrachochytrium salamandrivorans]|nr:hypothetical protein BASA83_008258 [Batrachochytrium salamandrivorans]
MWRQCRFTSPVFVTDCYWDTLGWKSIIPGLIGFQGWSTLTRLTVWRTVRLGQLGLRDLENLQQSKKIMPLNPEPMEPCVQDASDSGEEILPGPVSTWTLDSIHSDVYPFLDASPDSNSSVPDDILKEVHFCVLKEAVREAPHPS